MLRAAGVTRLIDVRAVPRSRFNPQYNRDALEKSLAEAGIDYRAFPSLGGLREARADSPNVGLKPGYRGFADYALTAEFRAAFGALQRLADEQPSAFMCAEADWRDCHRQLIADRLIAEGREVRHIMKDGIEIAAINPLAERRPGGLVYAKASVKAKASSAKKRRDDPKSPRLPGL